MALTPGTLLNKRYQIESILGQGGMGAVYRAHDTNLGIPVAVKENLFLSDEYARQFQREANIMATFRQNNLPRVVDYFTVEGQGQYLIMDFIEGEDLRKRIERLGTISTRDVVLIGAAICDALTYLHNRQPPVVHRDIKPGNIKITPAGDAVLVDFGLAKLMEGNQNTTTGARAMTPGYSPPEQYGTARTDVRSDIYSLGATLYAAMTGMIPEDSLARATGKADLTPLRELDPKISRHLAETIEKSLEVEPDDRFQSAEELKEKLLQEIDNLAELSRPHYVVAPPPDVQKGENGNSSTPAKKGSGPKAISASQKIRSARKRKARRRVFTSLAVFLVLVGLVSTAILRPDLTNAVMASVFVSPTPEPAVSTPSNFNTRTPESQPTSEPPTATLPVVVEPTSLPAQTTEAQSTPTITPIPITPQLGGGTGEIVFASDRTGSMQIWIMNTDGSNQRQLTTVTDGVCQPTWSPDGMTLAVISPCSQKRNPYYEDARIYLLDADGTNMRPLMENSPGGDFDPAWSWDGKKIAFTSQRNEVAHIFIYDLVETTISEVSNTPQADFQPAWAPDGKRLAFVSQKAYNHIFIMSITGEDRMQFSTNGNVNDYWPDWGPDNQFILFSRSKEGPFFPWLLGQTYEDRGKEERRIPPLNEGDTDPKASATISPDGKWIIFESWPDGRNHDIYIMDIDGFNRKRITTDPGFDFEPDWRPLPPVAAPD